MGGQHDTDDFQLGDKIRIRSGPTTGARGVIAAKVGELLEIQLDENGIISVSVKDVTNYSLAARRAWKAMPKRSGRPQGNKPVKRMVSMRIDPDIWDMLQEAAQRGLIPNREKAVNDWLRERITQLLSQGD